jgi:DNA-binding transcriptional LysR family regulator
VFSRFSRYFDEVARQGSIRRAAEVLHIAPSAVDRQILKTEEWLGFPLFERMPQGLRLTPAGELLLPGIRRWRKDFERIRSQIDELRGMRRGEITLALVEGAAEFAAQHLTVFHTEHPGITHRIHVAGSRGVVESVRSGESELGLTFNPPDNHTIRVERTLIFRLGAAMRPDHPLAGLAEVSLSECSGHRLILPSDSLSLRSIIDLVWARAVGGEPHYAALANNVSLMKSFILRGLGIGLLTGIDVLDEVRDNKLVFVPLADKGVPLSVLSLITASGRPLSPAAAVLVQHLSRAMATVDAPVI